MTMAIFLTDWTNQSKLTNSKSLSFLCFSVQFGRNLVCGQLMLLPYFCFFPTLVMLMACSQPAPSLLLACSWSAPALLLVLPTPVWQPSSSSAPYDFFRHGESRLLWYLNYHISSFLPQHRAISLGIFSADVSNRPYRPELHFFHRALKKLEKRPKGSVREREVFQPQVAKLLNC